MAGEWAGFDDQYLIREIGLSRRRVTFGGWFTLPYARRQLAQIGRTYGEFPA